MLIIENGPDELTMPMDMSGMFPTIFDESLGFTFVSCCVGFNPPPPGVMPGMARPGFDSGHCVLDMSDLGIIHEEDDDDELSRCWPDLGKYTQGTRRASNPGPLDSYPGALATTPRGRLGSAGQKTTGCGLDRTDLDLSGLSGDPNLDPPYQGQTFWRGLELMMPATVVYPSLDHLENQLTDYRPPPPTTVF
uniref:Uncharacterized protein n=1 Tax=Timema cristinae TaxID=61476 RepID=A0A7R9CXF4_TIMCR|nr:unnamed protein product [Timema cristinae]